MIPRLKELLAAGGTGYVVTMNSNNVYRGINRVCEANNLPSIGVHGLRHSFISLAYHLGWSELATMRVAGFSDYQTMKKIYTHLAEIDQIKNQNAMKDFFQK